MDKKFDPDKILEIMRWVTSIYENQCKLAETDEEVIELKLWRQPSR